MVMTTAPSVFAQILDYANRADPYPLYADLRKTPVTRQDDGSYVVSTYREIVDLLQKEIAKAVAQPDVKEKLAALGFVAVANTPGEFATRIKAEIEKWGKIVRAAKLRIE